MMSLPPVQLLRPQRNSMHATRKKKYACWSETDDSCNAAIRRPSEARPITATAESDPANKRLCASMTDDSSNVIRPGRRCEAITTELR